MTRFFPVLFVLLMLAAADAAAQSRDLRYVLKEGATLKYKKLETMKSEAQTIRGLYADIDKNTEAYISLKAEKAVGGDLVYVFLQDTAFVEDRSQSASTVPKGFDFQNAISKKAIRVRISTKGDLRDAVPLVPIDLSSSGMPISERVLARQAAIFPALPLRSVKVGDTWTDAVKDTTHPRQKDSRFGNGTGTRYTSIRTTYSVDSLVKHNGYMCLKITWKGTISTEGKMIFQRADSFNEEESAVSGSLYFAAGDGLLVELAVHTGKEATSAMFSTESEVIPITTTSDMRLVLLPS